jgi:hypothetical protein
MSASFLNQENEEEKKDLSASMRGRQVIMFDNQKRKNLLLNLGKVPMVLPL